MSDERLQDLRRRAAQREPGARAALLATRLRTGDLTQERLELAAYVGDEDALTMEHLDPRRFPLESWARGIGRWGREAVLRAMVAVLVAFDAKALAQPLIDRWLVCPCDRHEWPVLRAWDLDPTWDVVDVMRTPDAGLARVLQRVGSWDLMPWRAGEILGRAYHADDETLLRDAIRHEVAPWALGERDPVRERVEAAGPD